MINDDVITLVSEAPKAHGIFEPAAETGRQVYCQVNSVTRSEFWRAHEAGLNPSYVFRLSEAEDYQGEKIVIYRGVRYRVLRAYAHGDRAEANLSKADRAQASMARTSIDLTVGEVTVDGQ